MRCPCSMYIYICIPQTFPKACASLTYSPCCVRRVESSTDSRYTYLYRVRCVGALSIRHTALLCSRNMLSFFSVALSTFLFFSRPFLSTVLLQFIAVGVAPECRHNSRLSALPRAGRGAVARCRCLFSRSLHTTKDRWSHKCLCLKQNWFWANFDFSTSTRTRRGEGALQWQYDVSIATRPYGRVRPRGSRAWPAYMRRGGRASEIPYRTSQSLFGPTPLELSPLVPSW